MLAGKENLVERFGSRVEDDFYMYLFKRMIGKAEELTQNNVSGVATSSWSYVIIQPT